MHIDFKAERFKPENLAKDTLFNCSLAMDWQAVNENGGNYDGVAVAFPAITESILDDYWPEWQEWQNESPLSDYDGDRDAWLADAVDAFEESDSVHEWRDSFFPVMNFAWPIRLRADPDRRELAGLLDAMAGCVTLVTIDDSDYLALTGGGMDLSWNLCAAYVACGCMPPLRLLRGLPAMASDGEYSSNISDPAAALVVACLPVAADCMEAQAGFLRRDVARLSNKESGA